MNETAPVDVPFDGVALRRPGAPRPRRKPEAEVVGEGINYLRGLPHSYARKVHGGAMGNIGEPDVDACVGGRACKLEAKAADNSPSRVQIASLKRWQRAGALVGWFRTNDHLRDLLDHIDDPDHVTDLAHPGCSCSRHREPAKVRT